MHDNRLDNKGQFGLLRRCNQYPFDPKLRKKKKFRQEYNATVILDRKTLNYFFHPKRHETKGTERRISTQLQVDKLCRGTQLRVN